MAGKKCRGTPLKVFSGKEAALNRVILLILNSKKLQTKYDLFLLIRNMKGFRHLASKTVYRRIDALQQGRWITQNGTRPAKVEGDSALYELTLKGKAGLSWMRKVWKNFLTQQPTSN